MRYLSLLLGVAIVGFGILLVSTHGNLGGVNIPGLVGIPSCSNSANSTTFCPGFAGYSIGTVVALFGLGLVGNGLRSMGTQSMMGRDGAASLFPPQMLASMEAATKHMQTMGAMQSIAGAGAGARPGVVYCSKCGRANNADAAFCQQCGGPMTVPPPQMPASATSPPSSAPPMSPEPSSPKPGAP